MARLAAAFVAVMTVLVVAGCRPGKDRRGPNSVKGAEPLVENLTVAGLREKITDGSAAVTVVNVWATWCLPCREEFPELLRFEREYRDRGVRLMLVSADFPDRRDEVVRFLNEQGVAFGSYLKDGPDMAFIDALSPDWSGALPGTFVFDRSGALRWSVEGAVTYEALRDAVEGLLKKHSTDGRD